MNNDQCTINNAQWADNIMKYFVYLLCFCAFKNADGQRHHIIDSAKISRTLDSINRLLDQAVVQKNAAVLHKHYADDFVFTHGTGMIDNKQSWIRFVTSDKANYQSRLHDSVNVEVHKNAAVVKGKLTVKNITDQKPNAYAIKYYRYYVLRNRTWQLLSHNTYKEWKISLLDEQ